VGAAGLSIGSAATLVVAPTGMAESASPRGPRFSITYGAGLSAAPYGPRAEHCWNGDHTRPNATSRLRYHQFYAPKIVERILKTAPPGGDVTSWWY
jgi:hypothetical protein